MFETSQPEAHAPFLFVFDVSQYHHLQVLTHKTVLCATYSIDDDGVNCRPYVP